MAQQVHVTGGLVAGTLMDDGSSAFYGIPYAAPPVGTLRWREPQPVIPWTGVKQARAFAPACAQTVAWIKETKSEDCLYLNIWAPPHATKLPVIVWIHGGGYDGGSGAQHAYNGANLARRGAIVVTFNYRLGIFGFFAHPELTAESPVHASGNQGILDQIAALRWVKNNIEGFGGDPGRVMIAGQSAGGSSVQLLMVSPLARGLFQRGVSESGAGGMPLNAAEKSSYDQQAAELKGQAFARSAGATDLAALRSLGVTALQQIAWVPDTSIDGYVLREDLDSAYRHHRNDVPFMVGWNAEEGKDLAPDILGTAAFTAAHHREQVAKLLGYTPSESLLAAYPGATDEQAKASIVQLTTDWWGWQIAHWAALQAKYGGAKSYVYFFAHQPAAPLKPCGYGCGSGHGAEIRYVFDNLGQDHRAWSVKDRQLAAQLASAWVNFARDGNPNGPGLPAWPPYDGSNATVLRIGEQARLPDLSLFER